VTERYQVLDELLRATHAVAEDGVDVDSRHRPVDQHKWNTELGEPKQVALRPVTDRCDHDSLDPVGDHLLDHLALDVEVAARVAQNDSVARSPRDVLGGPHDQGEEGVCDVRHDQGQRSSALAAQPAREPARDIAEILDRLLDASARLRAHPRAPVGHARDRHG